MKRIISAVLLLLPTSLLADTVWSPSLSLSVEYEGSHIEEHEEENAIWSTARTAIGISPLSMTINEKHTLSLPMELAYTADSSVHGRLMMPGYFSTLLALRYGYHVSRDVEIAISLDTVLQWHNRQNALSWRFGMSTYLTWYPFTNLGLSIPLSASWSPGVLHFNSGLILVFNIRSIQ